MQDADPTDGNPYRYCGQYHDVESGYVYLRARYYDPAIGRFVSEDPAFDGHNWYVYCANNPVMYVDPSGMEKKESEYIYKYPVYSDYSNEFVKYEEVKMIKHEFTNLNVTVYTFADGDYYKKTAFNTSPTNLFYGETMYLNDKDNLMGFDSKKVGNIYHMASLDRKVGRKNMWAYGEAVFSLFGDAASVLGGVGSIPEAIKVTSKVVSGTVTVTNAVNAYDNVMNSGANPFSEYSKVVPFWGTALSFYEAMKNSNYTPELVVK
jgi:RHS repeat-associated protein